MFGVCCGAIHILPLEKKVKSESQKRRPEASGTKEREYGCAKHVTPRRAAALAQAGMPVLLKGKRTLPSWRAGWLQDFEFAFAIGG